MTAPDQTHDRCRSLSVESGGQRSIQLGVLANESTRHLFATILKHQTELAVTSLSRGTVSWARPLPGVVRAMKRYGGLLSKRVQPSHKRQHRDRSGPLWNHSPHDHWRLLSRGYPLLVELALDVLSGVARLALHVPPCSLHVPLGFRRATVCAELVLCCVNGVLAG